MWSRLENLEFNVVNHQMVFVNNELVIFGGYRNSTPVDYKSISVTIVDAKTGENNTLPLVPSYVWNIYDNTIRKSDVVVEPLDCFGHTVVKWKTTAILFGGCFCASHCPVAVYLFLKRGHPYFPGDVFDLDYVWMKVEGVYGDAPLKRDGHSVVVYRDNMYVFGGLVQSDDIQYFDRKLYKLDLTIWKWSLVYSGDFIEPLGRDFCSLVAFDNAIYLFGGRSSKHFQKIKTEDIYDTAVWKFDLVAMLSVALKDRKWTIVHNGTGVIKRIKFTEKIDGNDLSTPQTKRPIFPLPRRSHMTALLKNEMIIFGGIYEHERNDFNIHFNDVWSFNLEKGVWTCLSASTLPNEAKNSLSGLRRAACVKLTDSAGIIMTGGVAVEDDIRNDPELRDNVVDLHAKSLTHDINVKFANAESDLRYSHIPQEFIDNELVDTFDDVVTYTLDIYEPGKMNLAGVLFEFELGDYRRINLTATNKVFLYQPFVSLYEITLSAVASNCKPISAIEDQYPDRIVSDLKKLGLFLK